MKKLISYTLVWAFFFQTACTPGNKQNIPLRVRLAQDPESLHPLSYGNAHALQIINLVYQSLLTVEVGTHTIHPLLAAELPKVKVEDSLSYFTFQLRPQARWDDGTPISAKDVAFSIKLLHSPLVDNERWRAQYHFIKDILLNPQDPKTITLVCRGYTPELNLLAGDFFILPSHVFDPKEVLTPLSLPLLQSKYDSLSQVPALKEFAAKVNDPALARDTALVKGSGAYQLTSWVNGQQVVLRKKTKWWGHQLAPSNRSFINRPEKITFLIIPDNAAAALALKSQQIDLMDNIPLSSFVEMKKNQEVQKKFKLYTAPTFDLVFMGMNGFSKKLHDKITRQALAHLVNIPQITKTLQGGFATPTIGLVHPEERQFYNYALQPIKYNITKAQQLLGKAGWKKDAGGWVKKEANQTLRLAFSLMYRAGNSEFENIALLFQQNAKALGIPVTLLALESSQISERLQQRNYDLYLRTFVGNPFSYNLIPMLHTSSTKEGGGNVTNFGNAYTDQLLEKISIEESSTKKSGLLKQLQKHMQEESNMLFLFFQQNKMAVSTRVDSVIISSLKPGYDLPKMMLKN